MCFLTNNETKLPLKFLDKIMLLSIVVLSYNRPKQIERILEKFIGVENSCFNLIIKDDISPKADEIKNIFEVYNQKLDFEVVLHTNSNNLGYDRNLLDAFNVTDSEYIFLLSDDDYVDGNEIEELISVLSKRQYKFYFTPYTDHSINFINRDFQYAFKTDMKLSDFPNFIYNSILFSGLIYHRDTVLSLELDRDFLSNCIYTQVYLAANIAFETKSYGTIPSGVLHLGGDGDNFFGKNAAAKNSDILSDRSKLSSNLNYQPFLLKVVDKLSQSTDSRINHLFLKEYKKRLISYGLRSRSHGLKSHMDFIISYMNSKTPFFLFPFASFLLGIVLPSKLAGKINSLGKKLSRNSG